MMVFNNICNLLCGFAAIFIEYQGAHKGVACGNTMEVTSAVR